MGLGRGSGFSDGNITIGTQVDTYGISQGLNKIQKSFNKLKSMAGVLGGFGLVTLGKQAIEAASNLAEVQNIVDVSFGEMEYKIENFAKTCIDSFGMSEFSAKQTAGSFMAMGKAAGISMDEASDMAVRLTALSGDMASFYNIRQEYAKVALSAVYTGETETLKRYGIILTEANLQQYALTQGITTSVKAMSARDKAMLRYNYILQATADVTGDFVRTQDNWANQVRVLKEVWNQFLITVGSGLITILKPAIKILNVFIRYLTAWANKIGHILARLLGIDWEEISSGAGELEDEFGGLGGATDDLADSTDGLADSISDSAKKAKKALAPFDELNVLEEDLADSSGKLTGLGIGIPMADGGLDFGDVLGGGFSGEVEIPMPDISSWYEFGKYLSDTLKDILDKINWDEIYEKARNFGTNLASFLNGLIQPDTFHSVGVTIAGALNTAIEFALGFGQEFDFTNFGLSLSEAINGFFEEWNAKDAAECINTWVQGFWEAIKAFFKGDEEGEGGIDWPLVKNKLNEFFSNIDIETIGLIVGTITIVKVGQWLFGGAALKSLGELVGKLFSEKILPAVLPKIGAAFATFFSSIGSAWASLGGIHGLGSAGLTFEELFGAGTAAEIGVGMATEIVGALVAAIGGLIAGTNLGGVFSYLFTGDEGAYEDYMGLTGWITMIKDFGIAIKDFVADPDIGLFGNLFGGIKDLLTGDWDEGVTKLWKNFFTWNRDNLPDSLKSLKDQKQFIEDFKAEYTSFGDWISTPFVTAWTTVSTWWTGTVIPWFTRIGVTIKAVFTTVGLTIKTKFNEIKTNISNKFNEIKTNIITKINLIKTNVVTTFTNIKTSIINIFNTLKNGIKTPINAIIGFIESMVNFVIDGINLLTSALSNLKIQVPSWVDKIPGVPDGIGGSTLGFNIPAISNVQIPRLAKGAVIPPNKEFLAVLGDQKHGTNIEAPLDTLVAAFREASENNGMLALMTQQIQLLQIIADKNFSIGDNEVFKSVQRSANSYIKMTGTEPFRA